MDSAAVARVADGTADDADWPTARALLVWYINHVFSTKCRNIKHSAEILGMDRNTVSKYLARNPADP